ncbi:MAG: glutaredoxin family protein [Methylomonas sp.]|nr:glutaredoxin family protein [Methylomonas sp.]
MADWILFGTDACHLCEQAELMLQEMGLSFDKREVLLDENWLRQYGLRIPVLFDQVSASELAWPFSKEDLAEFIMQTSTKTV